MNPIIKASLKARADKIIKRANIKAKKLLATCLHTQTEYKYEHWDNEFHRGRSRNLVCVECEKTLSETEYLP